MKEEWERIRDEDQSNRCHPFTGWDPGTWPTAGDDNCEWEERLEHELQADFPEFDVGYGVSQIKDDRGSTYRAWSAQCHRCGSEIIVSGPIKLRNAMALHTKHYVRRINDEQDE